MLPAEMDLILDYVVRLAAEETWLNKACHACILRMYSPKPLSEEDSFRILNAIGEE